MVVVHSCETFKFNWASRIYSSCLLCTFSVGHCKTSIQYKVMMIQKRMIDLPPSSRAPNRLVYVGKSELVIKCNLLFMDSMREISL